MEWVETTAATIEEAKNLALDQLGVADDDAEFEVVDEPKQGLFGRTRGEARVRARIKPKTPRAKAERRERGSKSTQRRAGARPAGEATTRARNESSTRPPREPRPARERSSRSDQPRPEQPPVDASTVSAVATTFLEGVLRSASLAGSVVATVENDDIDIQVDGEDLNVLVGQRGTTLMALQDLTRVVSQRRLGDHDTHLRIDIAKYRERRREALGRFAIKVANEVLAGGQPRALEAMNSADRKIVHDSLAEMAGIATHSEGEDPNRRVVVSLGGLTT
ncbi:MAG: RNA-binding cell elongation regulator Jag/EloR [Ilumatobacteraceae bacterium]